MRICLAVVRRLGQKVNNKIDAYGHDADDSGTALCAGDAAS